MVDNIVLNRARQGICPICAQPLDRKNVNGKVVYHGNLVDYKGTPVLTCFSHICPSEKLISSGEYIAVDSQLGTYTKID